MVRKLSNLLAYKNESIEEKRATIQAKILTKIERSNLNNTTDMSNQDQTIHKSRRKRTLIEMKKRLNVLSGGARPIFEEGLSFKTSNKLDERYRKR
jgi:hypothetical protein